MDKLVAEVLGKCRHEKLEAITQELVVLHSLYQTLRQHGIAVKGQTSMMGRLNPLSSDKNVKALRDIDKEVAGLKNKYSELIQDIRNEVHYANRHIFPLQIGYLLDSLHNQINNLRAKPSFWSEEWGKLHLTDPCVLEGKDELVQISHSLKSLLIQNYGASYSNLPSEKELVELALRKVLSSAKLPLEL